MFVYELSGSGFDSSCSHIHYNPRLFADDTSFFSTETDETLSNSHLNDDLSKMYDWAYKCKMSFNPDSTKPATEVVFTRKKKYSLPSDNI